jgi:CRP-like cAMP-binding protein
MLIEQQTISEYLFNDAFSAACLFCDLSPKTQQALTAIKQKILFEKDVIVFANGEFANSIYFLLEGKAQMFTSIPSPEKTLTRQVEPNELFGLTEAITERPYETNLKTVTPCLFDSIRHDDFIRFLQDEPEACFRLLQMLGTNTQKIYALFSHTQ